MSTRPGRPRSGRETPNSGEGGPRRKPHAGERALPASEARYRLIFEQANVGIARADAEGRFLEVNPAFAAMLGYSTDRLVGMSSIELTHPDERDLNRSLLEDVVEGRSNGYQIEKRFLKADGSSLWVSSSVSAVRDLEGRIEFFIGLVQDISERKLAEEELRKHSRAVEQSPASVIITDVEGRIEYVNPKFTRLTGYSLAEALGQNPRILKSGEQTTEFYREMWNTIRSGREWHGEFRNRKKNGEPYWESASISPLTGPDGAITHYIAVKEDITERKRAEESLRRAEDQLRQAQKMEAIGRLAGGVAHDFNNLLTAILGYCELSSQGLPEGDPLGRNLAEISRAAERASGLTRQLLAFSRKQVLQPRVLDLNLVVIEMEKMLRHLIGEDIELETRPARGLALVQADPGQIEQVVMNLALNARDAMPQGGRLTIETANLGAGEAGALEDSGTDTADWVMLAVRDNGVGMDRSTQARIFEPFFTTKEKGRGTGLGLSTVYGIVNQSGGTIEVESAPGSGTTFRIYLPRVEETAEGEPVGTASAESEGTGTVLVVEDEDLVRSMVCEALRMRGYRVIEAAGPRSALEICEGNGTTIDLMLTDVVMPQMNGMELARLCSRSRPNMKILFMTGYSEEAISRHGILAEGAALIQKPFTSEALATKVRLAIGG